MIVVEQVKLLSLTSDFVFRTLFTRSTNSLIDLVNSALGFEGERKIKALTLQPPELPKGYFKDKSAILDIKAQSHSGELLNIEMQTMQQSFYRDRALYYWSKLFAGQLVQGQQYIKLQNTYSINFLNFNLNFAPFEVTEYKSWFSILKRNQPQIQLTDKFQMVFFELPKFEKHLKKVGDNLELWLYVMKNTPSLDEDKMRIIVDKNPVMQETFTELKRLSIDPKLLSLEEMRRKSKMDYESAIAESIEKGMEKGREEGIEKVAKAMLREGCRFPYLILLELTGLLRSRDQQIKENRFSSLKQPCPPSVL